MIFVDQSPQKYFFQTFGAFAQAGGEILVLEWKWLDCMEVPSMNVIG
jgi:hypothetical protein